jgi:hypothetical protein
MKNQIVSSLIWLWWIINLTRFEFETGIFYLFYLYLYLVGESCLLVSWCVGGRCVLTFSDEDHSRSRRPGAEDQRWSHRLDTRWPGDRKVECYRVRSALCTWRREAQVSWLSLKTKVDGLSVVWPQKPLGWFSPVCPQNRWRQFLGWASKPMWWRVSRFGPQNWQLRFVDLGLKITAMIFLFEPQNQAYFGLSVALQNQLEDATTWDTRRDLVAYFAWKQVWLGFPSLALRLVDVWWRVVHVVPSLRLHRSQVEDRRVDVMGCVGSCYSCFVVFILLVPMGIIVI